MISFEVRSLFRRMEFPLRPSLGATNDRHSGKLASLAPDVVEEILQNLNILDTWNCGGLNRHLRLIVQQEVGRRVRHFLQSTFTRQVDSFIEILRTVGGTVTGWCLLGLFYSPARTMEYQLPPTIIVPADRFSNLHLFLLALDDMTSFESMWLPQCYRTVCNRKWLYHFRVT